MSNKEKLRILAEAKRRQNLVEYEKDFSKFATEQIKIITKDANCLLYTSPSPRDS